MKDVITELTDLKKEATVPLIFDGYDVRMHHLVAKCVNLGSGGPQYCNLMVASANAVPMMLEAILAAERLVAALAGTPLEGQAKLALNECTLATSRLRTHGITGVWRP